MEGVCELSAGKSRIAAGAGVQVEAGWRWERVLGSLSRTLLDCLLSTLLSDGEPCASFLLIMPPTKCFSPGPPSIPLAVSRCPDGGRLSIIKSQEVFEFLVRRTRRT